MDVKLYHGVPFNMKGTTLYPLNEQKGLPGFEEIHKLAAAKYETSPKGVSRLSLMKQKVVPLDCLWNDVLHITATNPRDIADAFNEVGLTWNKREWFVIDPQSLDPNNTCIYLFEELLNHEDNCPKFTTHDPNCLQEYTQVTNLARTHYQRVSQMPPSRKKRPLVFAGIPHILYKGSIDTSKLVRIIA